MFTKFALLALSLFSSRNCLEIFNFNQTQCETFTGFHWVNQSCKNTFNTKTSCTVIEQIGRDSCLEMNHTRWEPPNCYGPKEKFTWCGCICPNDTCNVKYLCNPKNRATELKQCKPVIPPSQSFK